jgi:hypothetical protein
MRFCRLLATASVFAGIVAANPASAFIAINNLVVQPEGGSNFVVPFRGKSADAEFWCAAGDYVSNFLRKPSNTRIFRLSEPPRRSGEPIRFSLNSEGAASRTGLAVFSSGPTGSISAATAFALCPAPFVRLR